MGILLSAPRPHRSPLPVAARSWLAITATYRTQIARRPASAAIPYAAAGFGDSASLSIKRRLAGMKRPRLRMTQLAGLLLLLASGVGLWLGWPEQVTSPLLLAGGLVAHGPTAIAAWRERESKPPKSAEEVLRWYPKWWA